MTIPLSWNLPSFRIKRKPYVLYYVQLTFYKSLIQETMPYSSHMSQQELTDNPPAKCPYFTLPDISFLISYKDSEDFDRNSPVYATLNSIFGSADKMSDENKTDFLLALIKHSNWEPDFDAAAKEWNLGNSNHV